ncbi:MAG TPA: hypothetical protein VNR36_01715, partial [Pseudolysinimonas sp.]|nr:hypothetical protein [Pseudolysinimonas sp.]
TAGLISCTGPEGPPLPPGPAPSGTPVFASDEEALAAAEGAYQRYLDVTNAVGAGGWKDTSPLEDVERGDALADELATAESYREAGYRQVGETTFDSLLLQRFQAPEPGAILITVYLCLDVTNVDLLDEHGDSVVGPDRPDRQGVEVDIDDVDGSLKLTRSEPWSGASFC